MSLAVLVTSRPHNQQYHWTINELAARRDGLDTAAIDIVRENRPVTGLDEPEAALITFGRELFGQRNIGAETYAQALSVFGQTDLSDFIALMARHASEVPLLIAFDQQGPETE